MSAQISVSEESKKVIDAYAKEKGFGVGESADALVRAGINRLNALRRYAKKVAAPIDMAPKKKVSKIAKAANGVAKGPLARKQASKAKPPIRRKKVEAAAPTTVQ